MPYENSFRQKESWMVGTTSSTRNFGSDWPVGSEKSRFSIDIRS